MGRGALEDAPAPAALACRGVLAPALSSGIGDLPRDDGPRGLPRLAGAQPDSEYVELQMWSPGQNLVDGHIDRHLRCAGTPTGSADVRGTSQAAPTRAPSLPPRPRRSAQFGITADVGLAPGLLDPVGGAVCWESLDCVSWGDFTGSVNSPTRIAGRSGGTSPTAWRCGGRIAPDCPTLLEAADDTDNSATDFADAFPEPPAQLGRAGGASPAAAARRDNAARRPQTSFRRKPRRRPAIAPRPSASARARRTRPSSASSTGDPSSSAPRRTRLRSSPSASHTLQVRARDYSGNVDPSPASYAFKVIRKRR